MLAVIGGSGIYDLDQSGTSETITLETPFGPPSGPIRKVRIGETNVLFLARHGAGHIYSPTSVPYRANVFALKGLGATHLIGLSAVGSLREELPPRTLVIPDQLIDRTVFRERTFFESGIVAHVGIADPFCRHLRDAIVEAANRKRCVVQQDGTYVCIEGPQFSTRAESNLFRSWGASVIGMTAMPEARLAREAELCYVTAAMVTDYDVWHEIAGHVTVEMVIANLHHNTQSARQMIESLAKEGLPDRTCSCGDALANAIVTAPQAISQETKNRVGIIAKRYLEPMS